MAEIFVSYSQADTAKAKQLIEALERVGHKVWYDQYLKPGEDFKARIEANIGKADAVVLICTETSIASEWVMAEAAVGVMREKLIPVWYDKTLALPAMISHLNLEYLGSWDGSCKASEIEKLSAQLAAIAATGYLRKVAEKIPLKLNAASEDAALVRLVLGLRLPGGLSVWRYLFAALSSSLVLWLIMLACDWLDATAEDQMVGPRELIFLSGEVLLARGLSEIVTAIKKRSQIQFFDPMFAFSFLLSLMLGTLGMIGYYLFNRDLGLSQFIQGTVAMAVVTLILWHLARLMWLVFLSLQRRVY